MEITRIYKTKLTYFLGITGGLTTFFEVGVEFEAFSIAAFSFSLASFNLFI
jgi:hypothetical protein